MSSSSEVPCPNCVTGYKLPGTPTGNLVKVVLTHPDAYLANTKTNTAAIAIVFITDIFGLELINSKIMADRLNDALGVDVYVPNMFPNGPPVKQEQMGPFLRDQPSDPPRSVGQILRFIWLALTHIGGIARNLPSGKVPMIEAFIKTLKEEKGYEQVHIVGYCYGGGIAVTLATIEGLGIKTAVIAQPGGFSVDQVRNLKVPTCWEMPEEDDRVTEKMRDEIEAILKQNNADRPSELKWYKGTCHGFAARPNLGIPEVKEAFEAALQQTIDWFKKNF